MEPSAGPKEVPTTHAAHVSSAVPSTVKPRRGVTPSNFFPTQARWVTGAPLAANVVG